MAQLKSPETFKIGEQLTPARLNNIVDNITVLPGIISDQGMLTSSAIDATNDMTLIYDASTDSLKKTNAVSLYSKALAANNGKIYAPATSKNAGINIGTSTNPTNPEPGDLFIKNDKLSWIGSDGVSYSAVSLNASNTFIGTQYVNVSSTYPAISVTNVGGGTLLNVNNKFYVGADGRVGIGATPSGTANLTVGAGGITYADGTNQRSAMNSTGVANTLAIPSKPSTNTNANVITSGVSNGGYFTDNSTGFMHQWITFTSSSKPSTSVNFPIAFPNKALTVIVSPTAVGAPVQYNFAAGYKAYAAYPVDNASFTCYQFGSTPGTLTLMAHAIGY